jgi:amino acid adenylation domain-containing protein
MTLEAATNSSTEEEVFVFPASSAQQRLWFLDQLIPGKCFYNVPTVFRLVGELNFWALEQSFNEIVQRHESLRTTFSVSEEQPIQIVAPQLRLELPLIDLQSMPAIERETAAQQLLTDQIQRPFDLSESPLLRLMLLQLDKSEFILLVNLHHIIFDEWSSGLLIRELGILYTAFCANQPSPLPELPIQYADYAHWQQQRLETEVLQAHLPYWRQQLKDIPVLDLSIDRARPAVQSYQGTTQQLELSQDLAEALKKLSQQTGVTLFMTLLAGFKILLHRYTNQTDIPVGSPIANRNSSELEELIGFFVNSLVLRTDLSNNPTVQELLTRVRDVALAAYAHQDLPFEKLVEELQPTRSLSINPLFQVVFALQNAPMKQLELPGLTLSSLTVEMKTTRFDLELYLWECSEDFRRLWGNDWQQSTGLRGVIVYNTDLFERSTISRLLQSFQTILEGMVANPNQPISEVPVLSEVEQHQLLIEWNQTQRNYPNNQGIHQQFEHQVAKTPDAIAVRFADQQYTYDQLNRGSNQLARYLQQFGVGTGSRVGVCLGHSTETIAALLGILKAGAAYVPLDPSYPIERLQLMIEDAQVSVLLTQQQWADQFDKQQAKLVCLDCDWPAIAQQSEANLASQTAGEDLAYVIYTSGSTGKPKGVAVPHRAVNRLVCNSDYVQIESSDRIAQISNFSFDAATFEIWGALLNGAQLVGISREVLLSQDFAAQIQQQQISILFLTTALFQQFAREIPSAFASLRCLLFGGEAIDPKAVQIVLAHGAPQHLLHVYGPTENTTFTTWYEVQEVPATASIPIGRPIANTQLYLLDSSLKPVPIGAPGELYVGGDGLAQGYLNQPELTARSFIKNPFTSIAAPGDRLYKTGDLARYRLDGNLEFLGRIDHQVKLRGFRIELGEIEAVLSQHPNVQTAIVQMQAGLDKRLIAYVVPVQKPAPPKQELKQFLQSKLPNYMIPSGFAVLDAVPLTPNGKIDRGALEVAAIAQPQIATPLQFPTSAIEQTLAQLWAQLLGVEQVGVDDNFFELGGHSLLATQLMSRVRDRFQIEVSLRSLFETPTIAGLANQIETICQATQQSQATDPKNVRREEVEF